MEMVGLYKEYGLVTNVDENLEDSTLVLPTKNF